MYDLLIIFNNGKEINVKDVDKSGYNKESRIVYFEKEEYRSFLPAENVLYFGNKYDYEQEEKNDK